MIVITKEQVEAVFVEAEKLRVASEPVVKVKKPRGRPKKNQTNEAFKKYKR